MKIIPVIDLLCGQVVRARRGERARYQPIRSLLCDSCEPTEVTRALLELYPFDTLYIADLDAIQGTANNFAEIALLHNSFPHIQFWLDAGVRQLDPWPFHGSPGIRCVIGSEGLESLDQFVHLRAQLPEERSLLSLDFSLHGLMGPGKLLQHPELWSQQLICMTLAKVGSYEGPDFEKLSELHAKSGGQCQMYAAGGIRDSGDLQRLQQLGIAGALLASALHDGRIDADQIAGLMA